MRGAQKKQRIYAYIDTINKLPSSMYVYNIYIHIVNVCIYIYTHIVNVCINYEKKKTNRKNNNDTL